jgi:MFS family permease
MTAVLHSDLDRRVHRRLLPLYVATFLQGFVLWYNVEKLFMRSIGFDPATTGVAVAIFSAATLLSETPSGILADRWSRKGVLMLAGVALVLASVIGGLSSSVPVYLLAAAVNGVFLAFCSGTSDSIAYESFGEEGGGGGSEPFLGRLRLVEGAALVTSALVGGVVADEFGLRTTYLVTAVPALASVVVLTAVREPLRLASARVDPPLRQLATVFRVLVLNRSIAPVTLVLVLLAVLTYTYFDMAPLWLMTLSVPVLWFGPAAAVVLAGYGIGGLLGAAWQLHRFRNLLVASTVLLAASLSMAVVRSAVVAVTAGLVFVVVLTALTVLFTRLMHDSVTTDVRAAAASMINSFGRALIIPFVLVFGLLARNLSVFDAAWTMVGLTVATIALMVRHAARGGGAGIAPTLDR